MRNGTSRMEANGRIQGEQGNDGAEAMAILQALKKVNPADSLRIFCDNSGCISKWMKLGEKGNNTMKWGFRAIWNRIQCLMAERKERGSHTEVVWVHSHVDDEHRRTTNRSKLVCACRGEGQEECDPTHRHHVGNDRADQLAKEIISQKREGAQGIATRAEEVAKEVTEFSMVIFVFIHFNFIKNTLFFYKLDATFLCKKHLVTDDRQSCFLLND